MVVVVVVPPVVPVVGGMDGRTFFNLAFSVCSSLDAFAACRFSCFAVNYIPSISPHVLPISHALQASSMTRARVP